MNNKKIFSLILAMMMLLTLIPTGAFAEDFELFEEEFGQEEYWEDEQLFEEESYYEEPVYEDFYIGEEPAYEEVLVDEFVPEEEEAIIEETAPAEPVDSADEFKEDQIVTLGDSETFDASTLVVTKPADVTVEPDGTATFHVEVSGGVAPYTYKWSVLVVGKTAFQATSLSGYNTDTLSFTAPASYNGRKFRCRVTDANGETVTSEEALLTVEEPSKDFEYGDFIFTKLSETDKTLTLKKYTGNSSTVIVPELIEDYTTVEIGEGAFEDNITLQSVDLPDTITVIRARAFKGCTSLAEMK